jgi:hypothetical protein
MSFFIGHDPPEQQQHAAAADASTPVFLLYAIAATASPKTSRTDIASIILFIFYLTI